MSAEVALTGTATVPVTLPTDEGGTIHQDSLDPSDLDARGGVLNDAGFIQEVTQFVGTMAAALSIAPMAAIVRIKMILDAMERDRSV